MKSVKRSTDATVEKIDNGFVVIFSGMDKDDNYITEKFFFQDMKLVSETLSTFFFLPAY